MLISGFLSWVAATVMELFMYMFDTPIYGMAIHAINIFNGVARMDFFSTDAGAKIYVDISNRIYAMIGIIMIFFFSYQMILMVINPDGKNEATSGMVRRLITSLILIAFCPTIFHYMAVFQEHVLTEGTIFGIVTGTASGGDSSKSGKNTAMIVYLSMFHPVGGGYQSLVHSDKMDESGDAVVKTTEECMDDSNADEHTCELWVNATTNFIDSNSTTYNFLNGSGFFGGITAYSMNHDLIETLYDEKGSEYYPIIILVCGVLLAWFYISYTLDLGYRTIKLGFLQIIAPAPIIFRIFPKPKQQEVFDKWKSELIKTYLEIFARIAIVAFILLIVQKIPLIVAGLFNTWRMSRLYFAWGNVAMILGLMKFGKELPTLAKGIFDTKSGLFNGIDWKPGVFRRGKAGVDEAIGYGKKIGKKAFSAASKVATAGLIAGKGITKAGGAVMGLAKGAAAAKAANPSASGFKKALAMGTGAIKGASAGFKAGDAFTSKDLDGGFFKGIGNAIKATGEASSAAGSSVEAKGLAGWRDSLVADFDGSAGLAKNAEISNLKASNLEVVGGFMKDVGLDKQYEKIDGYKSELQRAFADNKFQEMEWLKKDADGNVTGKVKIKDLADINDLASELKTDALKSSLAKYTADGRMTPDLAAAVKDLGNNGLGTLIGIEGLDADPAKQQKFLGKVSSVLDADEIKAINESLGTNYTEGQSAGAIKERNAVRDREINAIDREIDERTAQKKQLTEESERIESRAGSIRHEVENDPKFQGKSDAEISAEVEARKDMMKKETNEQLKAIEKAITSLEGKKTTLVSEREDVKKAETVSMDDLKKAVKVMTEELTTQQFADQKQMEAKYRTLVSITEKIGKSMDELKTLPRESKAKADSGGSKDEKK